MRIRISQMVTVVMLLCVAPFAQANQLDRVLEQLIKQYDIPGMAVVMIDGDRIIESAVAGVRVRGGEEAVTLDDFWHLGSCTKAMTATLAARLVEAGTIDWDSTIAETLPDLADGMDPAYRDITLHQLLTHRGGLPAKLLGTDTWTSAWSRSGPLDEQRRLFLVDVLSMEPAGPVGEYAYSNAGYTLAGHMCSVAAGVPFEELLQTQVFEPLGMDGVGYGAPLTRGDQQPNGHTQDGTPSDPFADNPAVLTPAGRVHGTMQDWSRFVAAHLSHDGADGFLDSATFDALHTPADGPGKQYAMGWGTVDREWGGGRVLTHSGSNTMWYCVAWVAPLQNMAVLVACNQGGDEAAKACDIAATLMIGRERARQQSSSSARWTWDDVSDRTWIGADFWANRLQDWRVHNGRVECIERRPKMAQRTCHLLPWSIACPPDPFSKTTRGFDRIGTGFRLSVDTGAMDPDAAPDPHAWSGLLLGAGGGHVDHRLAAQVHHVPAEDGGLLCLVDELGRVSIRHNDRPLASQSSWAISRRIDTKHLPELDGVVRGAAPPVLDRPFDGWLEVDVKLSGSSTCTVTVRSALQPHTVFDEVVAEDVDRSLVDGSIALVSHGGATGGSGGHWFDDLQIQGDILSHDPDRAWGPVLMVQYTISDSVLNMTAQLPPLGPEDDQTGILDLLDPTTNTWIEAAVSDMDPDARTLHFRVEGQAPDIESRYRIRLGDAPPYEGLLRAEPEDDELVLGAMNCQKVFTGGLKWNHNGIWMPHNETVESVAWHDPDLLFFAGDQIYEGDLVPVDNRSTDIALLDYLYKWYRFCWSFGALTRDRPTVTIPDDHDVYHGNIWGAGGKRAVKTDEFSAQDSGGYKMPARFVNAVHATQTGHLPAPVDPEPIEQGISVYFTNLDWGGASFAILDDRMFKSSPSVTVPDGKFVNGWPQAEGFTGAEADVPGAELLGERQEHFLDAWATDWSPDTRAKVVLSQTLFANLNTLPPGGTSGSAAARGAFPEPDDLPTDWSLAVDADSNSWPQTPRNDALRSMRKGFAFHVCGDQHLGSTVQYGIDEHRDAGWAFCVPAVSNTWPRRWYPPTPGTNRDAGAPLYTGDFLDGFENRVTVAAVANPARSGREPANLHDRMPGYGIIRMQLDTGDVVFECWPRWSRPDQPDAEQYPGWPVQFNLADNASMPTAVVEDLPEGTTHVQVLSEADDQILFARSVWSGETSIPVYSMEPMVMVFVDAAGHVIERRRITP